MQLDPPPARIGLVTAITLPPKDFVADDDFCSGGDGKLDNGLIDREQMGVWLDGNRHCVFNIRDSVSVELTDLELRHSVYVCECEGIVVDVSAGKVNHITLDSCRNCVLRYNACISSLDVVRCHNVRLVATGAGTELLQCDLSTEVTSEGDHQPRNLVHSNNLSIRLADYMVPTSAFSEQKWTYTSSSTATWSTRSTRELRDRRSGSGIVVLRAPE